MTTRSACAIRRLRGLAIAALLCTAAPLHAAPSPLECMKQNVPDTLRVREMQLDTQSASGPSTLTGTVYARTADGEVALNLQIDAPADMRGAAFLFKQRKEAEEMYLYMPALNRVRRISGAAAESSLFGSALHYSDLRALNAVYVDTDVDDQGEAAFDEAPVRKLLIRPTDPASTTTTLALVDPESCLPLKLEVSQGGKAVREFESERAAIRQDETRWYLAYGTMRDLAAGVTTSVRMKELRGFDKMPVSLFNPSLFHQAMFGKK